MMILFTIIAVCLVVDIVLSMVFVGAFFSHIELLLLGVGTALTFLYIVEIVVMCFFWHRAWRSIQDSNARTTPGKAIGFIFIPLFNLYWVFVLLRGFANDFNAFYRRHTNGTRPPRLPEGFFLIVTIMWIAAVALRWLPALGGAVNFFVTLPRDAQILIRYAPVIGSIYGICFSLAMLVLLYKTACAMTELQHHLVAAVSHSSEVAATENA